MRSSDAGLVQPAVGPGTQECGIKTRTWELAVVGSSLPERLTALLPELRLGLGLRSGLLIRVRIIIFKELFI